VELSANVDPAVGVELIGVLDRVAACLTHAHENLVKVGRVGDACYSRDSLNRESGRGRATAGAIGVHQRNTAPLETRPIFGVASSEFGGAVGMQERLRLPYEQRFSGSRCRP
jgi:hypothetical protein